MANLVEKALVPPSHEEACWELFHENSKTETHARPPSNEYVRQKMSEQAPALPYLGYPAIELPPPAMLDMPLGAAVRNRASGREMASAPLDLAQLSCLLFHAYGETRDNADTVFPRPFRTVPSGGALFPLDLLFHTARVDGLDAGIYYYDPTTHGVRLVRRGDHSHKLMNCFVQHEMPLNSSLQLFMACFFERSTFKYGDRAYRFALLEAGHVGQNLNLAAAALNLACSCVGGYFDRRVDELLELDGVTRSTLYIQVVGGHGGGQPAGEW